MSHVDVHPHILPGWRILADDLTGALDTAAAFAGMQFDTLSGPVTMRAADHQATLGAWVGETTRRDKQGAMKNWTYIDGAKVMFSEAEVKAARKN